MPKIKITYPDGSVKEFEKGITAKEVAQSIGKRLASDALAAKIDDKLVDLDSQINNDAKLQILTWDSAEGKNVFRHSTAHVLAHAIRRLYPDAKNTIGPAIEDGFFYDFDDLPISETDFPRIEEEMHKIVQKNLPSKRIVLTIDEAKKLFAKNLYKIEMAKEFKDAGQELTAYKHGEEFIDLCEGPHVPSNGVIKAFKLMKLAGAYWRGDAKNKQLTRIYGTSFPSQKLRDEYLKRIEEAEKRDHRKLVKDLDLVYFHEFAPGAPFYLKKGAIIYNELVNFIRIEYKKRGYEEVITPQMYNKKLWEISGHWEHYRENMFIINVEGQEHSLKPMNCPSHCLIYNRDTKSYKDLPIRIADFCNLHRNEFSGTLTGLTRVRKFSQDDAHIFCRFDQIEEEVLGVLEFIKFVWTKVFGFKLQYFLSTRPEKALGMPELWDKAEAILANALKKAGIEYSIKKGDGAFYGPKIDIDIEDALGRKWQCPTCQLDFNLPQRFSTEYVDENSKKQAAVMIHRAVLGSLERFFGIMTEHYAGKFPLWLSPEQVRILTIANRFDNYAESIKKKLCDAGLRAECDLRAETLNKKIREAQLAQVNYIIVVGEKEESNKTANIRTRDNKVLGEKTVDEFLKQLLKEVEEKKC